MSKVPVIVHPFLFAIFPAVSLVSDHVRFLSANNAIFVMGLATLLVTCLCLLLLRAAGVDRQKAAIIVTLSLLLFTSYGHVYYLVSHNFPGSDFRHRHLLLIWFLFALLLVYFTRKAGKYLSTFTSFLNIVGATLVILSVGQIVQYEISTRDVWEPARGFEGAAAGAETTSNYPDIYYIILDAYASSTTLREHYNFKNDAFIKSLQNRGFFVAEESFSNYSKTTLSLASSLNMDYLNKLSPSLGLDLTDREYETPKQMIENNNVMWFLKSKGYTFIFVGSGYGVTQGNRYADREVKCGYIDETVGRIIQSTLIWPVADYFQIMANDDRNKRLCAFSKLAEMPDLAGPKFVFAHILAPHAPFLFDANGDPVRVYATDPEHTMRYYVNQLTFINKKVEETVDAILAKSEVEPIIILQGDTGPPYGFELEAALQDQANEIYQQNMRILNAYYLPQNGAQWMYEGISPVNTFRLIFNIYLDTDFALLDDESYFLTVDRPYRFINVTESVDYD